MRPIQPIETTPTTPASQRLQAVHRSIETPRRPAVEAQPVHEDRWRESQLEDPERWDGMS